MSVNDWSSQEKDAKSKRPSFVTRNFPCSPIKILLDDKAGKWMVEKLWQKNSPGSPDG
jgi:hypothetical protein